MRKGRVKGIGDAKRLASRRPIDRQKRHPTLLETIPAKQGSLRLQKDPQRGTLSFQLGKGFSLDLPHPFMTQMEIKTDLA